MATILICDDEKDIVSALEKVDNCVFTGLMILFVPAFFLNLQALEKVGNCVFKGLMILFGERVHNRYRKGGRQ